MKKSGKEFWLAKIFHSTWFFAVVLVFLIIFSVSLISEMMRKVEIQKEIDDLEEQVKILESGNLELGSLIDYFQTDEFIAKEARTKLGFKKAGETVVALPAKTAVSTNDSSVDAAGLADKRNWQIWWDYFFTIDN